MILVVYIPKLDEKYSKDHTEITKIMKQQSLKTKNEVKGSKRQDVLMSLISSNSIELKDIKIEDDNINAVVLSKSNIECFYSYITSIMKSSGSNILKEINIHSEVEKEKSYYIIEAVIDFTISK